jgi:galactokinase
MQPLVERFAELFGATPEVMASAPGRVNLIGEHIDFLEGFVFPFAISSVTTVAISRNTDNVIRTASVQKKGEIYEVPVASLEPKTGEPWTRYSNGVIWSLGIQSGLNILIDGQVPLGAGLSSSAALESSVAIALNHLFELDLSHPQLALAAQRAENEYVGMPCGIMDQSVSIMAKEGYALLLDCRDLSTQNIEFRAEDAGLELLVIDTQVHHALIDGGYAERRASCEKAIEILGIDSLREISVEDFISRKSELDPQTYIRAFHAVTEMRRVLDAVACLEKNDFVGFGEIVTQCHQSLRDNYTVSCPELDLAVDTARAFGALGSRMIGGGFGGSAISLNLQADTEVIKEEIIKAFAAQGFKAPRFFTSIPSAGARIIKIVDH